jgi:lipopolysaccharide transport system ATP-binding protein
MSIAVRVSDLSKKYSIGRQKDGSLRGSLASVFGRKAAGIEDFWALKDVSFEIERGDIVGIIGRNGAGKSTLLKLLSEITRPTTGRIELHGRVASLLEVGTGFHPELTGRENIFLNGTILGMTRREVTSRFDEIVAFSGVSKFIDTPVKHYSSGMYVRLAFAVAAHLDPEILIVDEVLAVGDAEFQKKCLGKMQDVASGGKTVLFVSHNMATIKSMCNRGILLHHGQKLAEGPFAGVMSAYQLAGAQQETVVDTGNYKLRKRGARQIYVSEVAFDKPSYTPGSSLKVSVKIANSQPADNIGNVQFGLFIHDLLQNTVYQFSTLFYDKSYAFDPAAVYEFSVDSLDLSPGSYSAGVWLGSNGYEQDYVDSGLLFEVTDGNIYGAQNPNIVSIVQKKFSFNVI